MFVAPYANGRDCLVLIKFVNNPERRTNQFPEAGRVKLENDPPDYGAYALAMLAAMSAKYSLNSGGSKTST